MSKSLLQSGSMEFTIKRSTRARSVTIRLDLEGQVIVSIPPRFPESRVPQYVAQAEEWITRHQAISRRRASSSLELGESTQLLYLGEPYTAEIRTTGESVSLIKERHLVQLNPVSSTLESITRTLERFLHAEAEKLISEVAHSWAGKMQQPYEKVSLRVQSSRWGSCSRTGTLSFNWKLIHAPQAVLEYVVIHELAHVRHMNHSDRFWAFVREFDPEYNEHRAWLRRYGTRVHQNIQAVAKGLVQ